MALIKEFPSQFGPSVTAKYHRILEAIFRKNELLFVQIASYASKEDRMAEGSKPLGTLNLTLPPVGDSPSMSQMYDAIKAVPDWSGAVDG